MIASYDRGFEYRKLQIAFDAIWFHKRARLVTTNPDPHCPLPGGRGEPDAAAIVGAIEACTGAKCEVNVGKPDLIMLETVLDMLGLEPSECIMTASNSIRVKPPSSVLRSSLIRHENQGNTFLPFFLHTSVTAGPPPATSTYSTIRAGTFRRWNQDLVSSVADRIERRLPGMEVVTALSRSVELSI